MNTSKMMRAIELARDGMFVPTELTREILSQIKARKNSSVLVLFSYEMLPVLRDLGYSNVTLAFNKPRKSIQNIAKYFGYTVIDLKDIEGMKFDVILSNPPYQDSANKAKNNKLWHKFVLQDLPLKVGGYVAFINPVSMFSYIGVSEKIMHRYTSEYSIKSVTTHDMLDYEPFPGVAISTCHWIAKKAPYDGKTEYNGRLVDMRDRHAILSPTELMIKSITDKVSSYKDMIIFEHQITDIEDGGKYKYLSSGHKEIASNSEPKNEGALKYVISFSSSYAKQFTSTKNVSNFNKYILVNNEAQIEQIKSFMLSKLMKFYAANYRKTAGFTPAVKNNMIPNLIRDKMWTNEELYKHFGLSKKEIEMVEKTK